MNFSTPPELEITSDGPIRILTLNRPDHLNAVNKALHWALAHVWRHLATDPEARVIVITGAGNAFSAGGDLDWISSFSDDHAARDESVREAAEIIEEVLRFPLPVIAAVNGAAVGLAASIAALADVVLIDQNAYLADPHISVGLAAGDGAAAFWPLLTPIMRTREFLYTGDRIDAQTAVQVGLASRVVTSGSALSEARKLAERLAQQPAQAIAATKSVVNMYLTQALNGPLQAGLAAELRTMRSEEHRERLASLRTRASGR